MNIIAPYGGSLVDLMATEKRQIELKSKSKEWRSLTLTGRQLCDLELLLNGGFSPLGGFMSKADYDSVCENMRLVSHQSSSATGGTQGTFWPMPICLDISANLAAELKAGDTLALRDVEGTMLACLTVSESWEPDRVAEAKQVFGTTDTTHPAVDYLLNQSGTHYVSGTLEGLQLPTHYDYAALRKTPRAQRADFKEKGWTDIVAFQTRNPMHRAHFELTWRSIKERDANLLIHPVVGMTKPGDVDYHTRVRCYQEVTKHYPDDRAALALLPLAMRMGGPREALLHAIIRRNYGCNHLIVGRDHAGPGNDSTGKPFYGPYDAQELFRKHEQELGVQMVPFQLMVYLKSSKSFMPITDVPKGESAENISGTELRAILQRGDDVPEWFTFPEVAARLKERFPSGPNRGLTIFLTGLSGSGKSTVANVLLNRLLSQDTRSVTLLDGDIVRTNLSSELGFSKEHRDLNIQRIGFVAAEITKAGGIAICAPIAPYEDMRSQVETAIKDCGNFVLVHVATPLEECERRDRKGLYAKARAGIIKEFTGISDPYDVPQSPDIRISTVGETPQQSAQLVMDYLQTKDYVRIDATA